MRGASKAELASENLLMLVLRAVTAIYGTRIIHTLRTEGILGPAAGSVSPGRAIGRGGEWVRFFSLSISSSSGRAHQVDPA